MDHRVASADVLALVESVLARIEQDRLNAFVAARPEAVDEAAAASRGPLHGLPVAVKDMFVDDGRIPTCGSRVGASWLSGTAEIFDRLRAAGAIVVGYTNLHEWGIGTTSAITATGPVLNPHDTSRVAGGSSGGSAAAVAAGMVPAAVGTDAGASIRVPAAYCGVVGLKPTYGRVPLRGFAGENDPVDHAGPIARSVAEAATLFEVLASTRVEDLDVSQLVVGVAETHFFADLDPEVAAALDGALALLRKIVREMTSAKLAGVERAGPAVGVIVPAATADPLRDVLEERPDEFQPETMSVLLLGAAMTDEDRAEALAVKDEITTAWERLFEEVDVVITPTVATLPPRIESPIVPTSTGPMHVDLVNIALNGPMNLGGVPALSLPCGRTLSGRTVNMTLTAARGRDDVVLALGRAFEVVTEQEYVLRT